MLTLKAAESIRVDVKAVRGIVRDARFKPGRFDIAPGRVFGFVSLKPGEDTPVAVLVPELPSNADVKSITARLDVADEDGPPSPQSTVVTIAREGEPAMTMQVTQSVPTRPRNVTVRLDKGEPIWSFSDTLVNSHYELPDFASQLNAYLDTFNQTVGQVTLNFLVKSDTPGKVGIVVNNDKRVTHLQTETWTNELDQTVRLDRNLELDFGDRWEIPLKPIAGSAPASLNGLRLDVGGTFSAERLLGAIHVHAGGQYATVSADYAIAQQFTLDAGVVAAGISGLYGADGDAELYVELQRDQAGTPAADAPLASATVALSASEGGAASWTYAQFETPATLEGDTKYWMVIKGVSGATRLGVESAPDEDNYLGPLMVNRTGRLWKPFAGARGLVSMLRLVYQPGIDNQSAAVHITIKDAPPQAVDPQLAARTLSFAFPRPSSLDAVIEIVSYARGALTVANVIQEY